MALTRALLASAIVSLVASPAWAISSFSPSSLSSAVQGDVDTLIKNVGVAGQFRAYQSAAPLGMIVGLDVGLDMTVLKVPSELKSALADAGAVTGTASAPDYIAVPRLNVHKGLPGNFDLGFSYFGDGAGNSVWGGDVRWALLSGTAATPALGFRASYSSAKLLFLDTSVTGLDAVVSKGFAIFELYAGLGLQYISGSVNIPTGQALAPTVSADSSTVLTHLYFGLPIKLLILKITPEYDLNFAGITTYGLKVSLSL